MRTFRFLNQLPRFVFFTGKGGVGKTSIACSTAVSLADSGSQVLLVSTDPASNLGQVFGQSIGNQIRPAESVPRLSLLEIDPQAAAQAYRDRIVGPVRGVLPEAVVRGMEEQLSGACTVEIAAFDEFTELLTDSNATAGFDHIVFDTAPTGHTIRLLKLPGAWSGFLDAGTGDASCLGPLSGLEKQRSQYSEAVHALEDSDRTRLVLVARAQGASLREAARTHDELLALGFSRQFLVINGLMPESEAAGDGLAAAIHGREQSALAAMPENLSKLPRDYVELKPFNLVGIAALRLMLADEPDSGPDKVASDTHSIGNEPAVSAMVPPNATIHDLVTEFGKSGHGLIMLMGKGGVGKTTLAAAIAVALAEHGYPVHLTTSDPAAHLTQTLDGTLENLRVSRIDPVVETENYRRHVLETKGARLDAQGKALLEEDLRSPCTEEIAVFQAFSRIIREAGQCFVVMDTAPTGHTLLLLDATGAYHREILRQAEKSAVTHLVTPMMRLQDPEQTRILIVTLSEPTPVLEAAELQADLRRAGLEPYGWIVNNSLVGRQTESPLLQKRARAEAGQLRNILENHASRITIVPLQQEEPVGLNGLRKLSQ